MADLKDIQQVVQEKASGAATGSEQQKVQSEMINKALADKSREHAMREMQQNLPKGVSTEQKNKAVDNIFNDPGSDQDRKRSEASSSIDRHNQLLRGEISSKDTDPVKKATWDQSRNDVQRQLESSAITGEMFKGLRSPAQKKQLTESVLNDGTFRTIANQRLHDVASRPITEKDKLDRLAQLQKDNPSANISIEQAAGQLEQEYLDNLNGVMEWSMQKYMLDNLDTANDVIANKASEVDDAVNLRLKERGKAEVGGAAKRLEQKWNAKDALDKRWLFGTRGEDGVVRQDFEKYITSGLEGVLTPAEWDAVKDNPDLVKEYEKQIGESLLMKRFQAGGMSQNEFTRLASASWMGGSVNERVDNLQAMLESNTQFKSILDKSMADGTISKSFLSTLAGEQPAKRIALIAMLLAGAFAIPAGIGAVALAGSGAGAGVSGLDFLRKNT